MSKIIGIVRMSFKPKDSDTPVEGLNIHIVDPIPRDRGEGQSTDHFFLSKKKIDELDFVPTIGMSIEVLYSKWGKIGTLRLLSDSDIPLEID